MKILYFWEYQKNSRIEFANFRESEIRVTTKAPTRASEGNNSEMYSLLVVNKNKYFHMLLTISYLEQPEFHPAARNAPGGA